jgi:hypothetical protein
MGAGEHSLSLPHHFRYFSDKMRSLYLHLSVLAASAVSGSLVSRNYTTRRPNIVFILTDDQDAKLDSMDYMPAVRKHMTEKGTNFEKHYCTVAVCCPSRVSLFTGKHAHNTNVTNVVPPFGMLFPFTASCSEP